MANVPMLRKVVEWVEEQAQLPYDQRQHKQNIWMAHPKLQEWTDKYRTRWVAGLNAPRRALGALDMNCETKSCVCGKLALDQGANITITEYGGIEFDGLSPTTYGAHLLGISYIEASNLFDEHNTPEQIREIAEEIAGERL